MRKCPSAGSFFIDMLYYDKIYDFNNLLKAHKVARRGKRTTKEVIDFEMNLAETLVELSESLRTNTYSISGYYSFSIKDPKERQIHALHYKDRVVQHCLCDEVLRPVFEKRLIFDNAACRIGKGTHFALSRLTSFFVDYYKHHDRDGWILRCDIAKFFDNIDHSVLKGLLCKVFDDKKLLSLLFLIIDSYETSPNKGLPLGNQTSQWFAIYYLDSFDRIIKEKYRIKYYTRYMDDAVIIHENKAFLLELKKELEEVLNSKLKLDFNRKTQLFPLKNGVDYLGFHFSLSKTGKIIRRLKTQTKKKFKRRVKSLRNSVATGIIPKERANEIINSYVSHMKHGHTNGLLKTSLI